MDHLFDAAQAYARLEVQHPDEPQEFITLIHRLQDMLATRICRRLYPDYWISDGGS